MNKTAFLPQKRDTNLFLDIISELKTNQKFQAEINNQISTKEKIQRVLKLPVVYYYIGLLIAPVTFMKRILDRRIEHSKTVQQLDVLRKQEKIYHKNVLTLEAELENTLELCNEHFDTMLEMIQKLADNNKDATDAQILLSTYRDNPPNNKLDRLQLFLSMEACWIRFR
jgi:hypothetical protein